MSESLHVEVERGHQASEILESAIYKDAIKDIREELVQALLDTPIRDTEGMTHIKMMIMLLEKVDGALKDVMVTGKMAKIQIERESGKRPGERERGGIL